MSEEYTLQEIYYSATKSCCLILKPKGSAPPTGRPSARSSPVSV